MGASSTRCKKISQHRRVIQWALELVEIQSTNFCTMSRLWFFGDDQLDLKHSKTGTVAMTSGGENLNASEFYFWQKDSQKGKGNGCFQCGSTDNVAKDCVGGNQSSKFIVKDQNRHHGGGEGYDMVFQGDIPEILK
ncbi:Cyclophilin-like domain superfamily [Arabidopsis suecica]|uniref:Cyclophilin-like domain superfamily n=1 Tax=Arabidopsis suecica TaxID=45249 RepID=A0A8T2CRG1_ARASU|nr:Cyclophilin-like domain superfamily [Arabidopsis suecica]